MGLAPLRAIAATFDNDETDNEYDGPDIPAHLDEPPPLQPWDADYTHCVFFDPDRFPTDAERDELLARVRRQFPEHLRWCLDPVSAAALHGRMNIYSAYHTRVFQQNGYVAEIEPPRFESGPPARSIRSQEAWDAFVVNAVIMEAIIDACRKLPPERQRNLVFRNALRDALTPICGLMDNADQTRGRNVLCDLGGLLVAPRSFDRKQTVFPADPVTWKWALKAGRTRFASFHAPTRRAIRRRADLEIRAWSELLEDDFNIDGLILWSTQNLALLRLQATEWKFRERPGYVKSGTALFAGHPDARATKRDYSTEHLQHIQNDLWVGGNYLAPAVTRPFTSVLDDIRSILAGGIGLEDETIWRDDLTLRQSYSSGSLEAVAGWVSKLKRMHHATLTESMAILIQEVVTDELDHLAELTDKDGQSALRLVRSQFPDAIWREILSIAINAPDHINAFEIRYRWNDNPTDPIALERDGDAIVIVGPMIDLRTHDHALWGRRAEIFRDRGSLTI